MTLTNTTANEHFYMYIFSHRCKHIFKINFLAVDVGLKEYLSFKHRNISDKLPSKNFAFPRVCIVKLLKIFIHLRMKTMMFSFVV